MALTGATAGYEGGAIRRRLSAVHRPARLERVRFRRMGLRVHSSTLAVLAVLTLLHVLTALLFVSSSASGEAAGWGRLPSDDAWTRMTYIGNFADSFTFEFNDGELATGGTSPLWIALNGTLAAVFGLSPDNLPVLSKALGILFGAISVWLVFRITWQITRKRYFGVLAGAVLAVEPHFGFAAVSGTEVTLFAAVSLAAAWAYLRGRVRSAGVMTAFAVAARPEGLLLALLVTGATLGRWTWRRDGAIIHRRRDVQDIAWIGVPSLGVIVAWVAFNWSVTGSALPDSYLATNETLGLLPLTNLWNVWLGYLHELPFMDGLAWLVGLPLVLLGIWAAFSRHSFSAAPVALFALAMAYAAMVTFARPDGLWLFDDRRHMDAAVPFIVILLVVGTARSWQLVWAWKRARKPLTERERKAVLITARVAVTALVIAPLAALPVKWNSLTTEYSWSSRNTNDVHVAMGRWLNENTPEDAVIGAIPAGAIGFYSRREVLDLSGKNTHDAQRIQALAYGIEQDVDYLVAFREPFFDSIPGREVANEERVSFGNLYLSNVMRAYGPGGSATGVELPRDRLLVFDPAGLEIIDTLDTGNGFAAAEASETTHGYGLEGDRASSSITARVGEDAVINDDFRSFGVAEEFGVASVPGQPLTIVKRYDATVPGSLRVFIDGKDAGTWELPQERTFFGEAAFTVPAGLVMEGRSRLRFEVIPGPSATAGTSFFYWILVPEGSITDGQTG